MGARRARVAGCFGTAAVFAGVVALPSAKAAEPSAATVSEAQPTATWSGAFTVPNLVSPGGCTAEFCDRFALTVDLGDRPGELTVVVEQDGDLAAPGVALVDAAGEVVAEASGLGTATLDADVVSGAYEVQVTNGDVVPGATYAATATLMPGRTPAEPGDGSVRYDHDEGAPVATVDVPLRVVMVGFEEGDVEAERIFAEIPDHQRVGSLYEYGGGVRGGDDSLTGLGVETLVNHGRAYYDEEEPFLLPIEMRWQPELHYAPSEFASGLFQAMVETSTTGDYANPALRAYLELYNASRGSLYRVLGSGDPAEAVAPLSPVRFVDGEDTEDWIAANAESMLGFPVGRDPGEPGYTVFVLNTWDSPEAEAAFPDGEYHVFRVERTDPDRGEFDGIDWARVWGGRYREMIVDLGAAPNAYESETWGNRARSALGSALYDPPLWEYRAGAPRPVTAIDLVNGSAGIEQAVTPGATWDAEALQHVLARTVNEAVNFRFAHSYLYEPRPGTGRFFLSDNVWHDATTLYRSDLERLYDQQAALDGLRTLTPYFEFGGDVVYQYLDETGAHPEYAGDQAALDQAKQDGDDVAGVPHLSMHTETMMDHIDSDPARFLRGGECATTVPTIQVVVPGHYAWALPVAAGIATNRDGVPWGFLNSVNDVTKWNGADKDQTLVLAHPNVLFNGTFTYTTIHEASHYLGLAHPHDTIGATRNPDGTPRYYDGFTWAFNTTASPTTYSHVETVYSVLDQESIARGHLSYYLTWTFEALEEAGAQWIAQGAETTDQLPARAAELRALAVQRAAEAQQWFAGFEFVRGTFAAQEAWRATAEYRDLAFGLEPGTSQVERGTQHGTDAELDAAGCASAQATGEAIPFYDPGVAPTAGEVGATHVHGASLTAGAGTLARTGGRGMSLGPLLLATALALAAAARLARRPT
jgi:hypothetical protein